MKKMTRLSICMFLCEFDKTSQLVGVVLWSLWTVYRVVKIGKFGALLIDDSEVKVLERF